MNAIKILFVATSHDQLGTTNNRTGVWLEEIATPYYIFKNAGAELKIASPLGGLVPVDPKSQSIIMATSNTKRFLKDEEAMNWLAHSLLLEEVRADDFDGVFLSGGHGPLWDIAGNKTVKRLLEDFNSKNKTIGAVCHGVAGLLALQNDKGEFLIKGKQITGFSNNEEDAAGLTFEVPFLLETELLSVGAIYSKASKYTSYVVADGNIVTGQNPASSEAVARKTLAVVQNSKPIQKPPPVTNEIVLN